LSAPLFTLTTDFGLRDPYVAEMKAVILGLCKTAQIVDITHAVEKFSIRSGAYMLASAAPYFPKGTINIAVVDPGVGSERRSIIVETKKGFFVGPDNGLLVLAAQMQGIKRVFEITNKKLMLRKVSFTFHGRDVFAPAAAYLAKGMPLEEFGAEVVDIVKPAFATVKKENGKVIGEILHVDDFGNIITNILAKDIVYTEGDRVQAELPHNQLQVRFLKTYADVIPLEPLLLIDSQSFLEIAINQGSAASLLQAKPGDKVSFTIS
jgi:S-adenosyl-L-methionine hydrolase (adenosine-forming)